MLFHFNMSNQVLNNDARNQSVQLYKRSFHQEDFRLLMTEINVPN